MAKALRNRPEFRDNRENILRDIKIEGTSPVADGLGVTEFSLRQWAEDQGLKNPPYATRYTTDTQDEAAQRIVLEFIRQLDEARAEIRRLRDELAIMRENEKNRETKTKLVIHQLGERLKEGIG